VDNRRFERINIVLKAEIILNDISYEVFVVNLSREGIFITTAPLNKPMVLEPGTNLKFIAELPSGDEVNLTCQVVWSQECHPQGLASNIGLKIIAPPFEYIEFLKKEGIDDFKSFISPDNEDF